MNVVENLYGRFQRLRTLQTHRVSNLPVVILMPHSSCNCRCVMCDIWKDNQNTRQLHQEDIEQLVKALKHFHTQKVVMSGGEALLNPRFFQFCELMKNEGIKISLLSTGLLVSRFAGQIVSLIDDLVVSLDGDQETHDLIRNTKGAFEKLASGVKTIKAINPEFRITARSVIQKKNFRVWPAIIDSAKRMQLNQISFLPADVSSHAFNRELLWSDQKKNEIMPAEDELSILNQICEQLIVDYYPEFFQGFIAESPGKLKKIPAYYAALYGKEEFPYKQCNAPWVSAVVEPDGTVRPCFFHESIGNIHNDSLEEIINGEKAMQFRKSLNVKTDLVCKKCVCYLNLPPGAKMN